MKMMMSSMNFNCAAAFYGTFKLHIMLGFLHAQTLPISDLEVFECFAKQFMDIQTISSGEGGRERRGEGEKGGGSVSHCNW